MGVNLGRFLEWKNQSKAQYLVTKRLKTFENIRKRSKIYKKSGETFENI